VQRRPKAESQVQWYFCEPLMGITEGLLETMGFRRRRNVCDDKQVHMSEKNEFQTDWAATLRPWKAKVVRTRKTDNRLVLV